MSKKKKSNIDLGAIAKELLKHKKLMLCNLGIAAVVFTALILCVPRYYTCEVKLAPEFDNSASAGQLSSIASSFGLSLGSGANNDAISPSLYPDLMESKDFIVELFDIKVTKQDGSLKNIDYATYLTKHQERAWWDAAFRWVKRNVKKLFIKKPGHPHDPNAKIDPFLLSEEDYNLTESIHNKITCTVDRKNYVITINVTDQDPLICATIADSVRVRLQNRITDYRTSKARVDVEYYEKLLQKAKDDYEKANNAYSAYADSHRDIIMQSYISQRDQLENDMQMKFQVYTSISQQYEAAKAKIQECTPAFTTLQCASVPVKPTGPKRVVFVLGMLIMTFIGTAFYIIKKDKIKNSFKKNKNNNIAANNTLNAEANEQTATEEI